ncbi:hypothetical protein Ple7327_2943 [Pleurocapsa sp. PCC 7327]|nr:hypothetical protein Ple7327_2943 [Pleurocapsa sp. PCC 7327]
MIRHFFLAATIALESTLALIFTTSAQTTEPYLNELLHQTNEFIQDSDRSLNELVLHEGLPIEIGKMVTNIIKKRKYNAITWTRFNGKPSKSVTTE